jgi:membrane-associated protease RseP (regulator of RpoE activity)
MDQPYHFSRPAQETASPSNVDAPNALERYKPTLVYRLPQAVPAMPYATTEGITAKRLAFHLFLLGLTFITTVFAGVLWLGSISAGLVYSFTVLSVLAAHEMGHYIACRWYGVEATLPYFIPVPLPPVGTFGAFIKIKSPIPSRRALFDIGIAGPLAGFVFVIPAAFIALYFAEPAPPPVIGGEYIHFQDPLLFKLFQWMIGAPRDTLLNPVMWAAWIGVFMTSLNLLPVGQLDGGHVTYAVFGRNGHRALAWLSYLTVIGLAIYSAAYGGTWNWVVYAVILTLMLRVGHPPVIDEYEPLGRARIIVALIGLLVFVLSFMPFPISF